MLKEGQVIAREGLRVRFEKNIIVCYKWYLFTASSHGILFLVPECNWIYTMNQVLERLDIAGRPGFWWLEAICRDLPVADLLI